MRFEDILKEAIEGLPVSHDPYEPAKRDIQPQPGPDEPVGVLDTEDQDVELDDELGDMPANDDIAQALGEDPDQQQETNIPFWEPMELPNKKDIGYKRSDGFNLRARRLSSVPNKWVAQLYKDDEVLDKGTLFIGDDKDPGEYLQRMSDYMLDNESNRYTQQQLSPGDMLGPGAEIPPEGEEPAQLDDELTDEPDDLVGPDVGEDLGIDDENFEFE